MKTSTAATVLAIITLPFHLIGQLVKNINGFAKKIDEGLSVQLRMNDGITIMTMKDGAPVKDEGLLLLSEVMKDTFHTIVVPDGTGVSVGDMAVVTQWAFNNNPKMRMFYAGKIKNEDLPENGKVLFFNYTPRNTEQYVCWEAASVLRNMVDSLSPKEEVSNED